MFEGEGAKTWPASLVAFGESEGAVPPVSFTHYFLVYTVF